MTEITPLPYNGNIPFSTATPFTYREGVTNLELIHALKDWALRVVPDLNSVIGSFWEKYVEDHAAILDDIIQTKGEWQALFDQFMADVVAQLEGLNDQAMANLIRNAASETGTAIVEAFDNHHSPEFFVDVAEFGALHDGSDASAAFIAANAYALETNKTLVGTGVYTIRTETQITANCDFSGMVITADLEGNCLDFRGVRKRFVFPTQIINSRKGANGTGWASVTNSVGATVSNSRECDIHVGFIQNFETGLRVVGLGTGCAYNNYYMGTLWHNKWNMLFEGDAVGYANQNNIFGGRWLHNSADVGTNATDTKHIWFKGGINADDGGRVNNNTFHNCSLEGAATARTLDMANASSNIFINCRYEFGNEVYFGSNARDNLLLGGFGLAEIKKTVVDGALRNEWESATEKVHYSKFIRHRNAGQEFPWLEMNWAGRSLAIGVGSAEPRKIRASSSAALSVDASWLPEAHETYDMGTVARKWRNIFAQSMIAKNVTFDELGYPTAPTAGGRLYVTQDGSGKLLLGVRWPDGTSNTIVTQP